MPTAKQFISENREFILCDLGEYPYNETWRLQSEIFNRRAAGGIDDTLLLVEHPHTYTLGKTADSNNLIYSEDELRSKNISVFNIDRGGDITYHGPGQLVGYPIINLNNWKRDAHLYLRGLEQIIINTCANFGLKTGRKDGLTGVWIEDRKIAAIGIKVSRWITMHGFAFNINTDLSLFSGIIPCGIKDKEVTSLAKELGIPIEMNDVKQNIVKEFKNFFEFSAFENIDIEKLKTKLNEYKVV